jgi:hypothetical protein
MSSFVEFIHVKCAIGVTPKFSLTSFARETVKSLVPPPAPYVTLIKDGFKLAICSIAPLITSKVSLVLGGNTSKESDGFDYLIISIIFIFSLYYFLFIYKF